MAADSSHCQRRSNDFVALAIVHVYVGHTSANAVTTNTLTMAANTDMSQLVLRLLTHECPF